MKKRNTQFPSDATVLDEPADGAHAPPESSGASSPAEAVVSAPPSDPPTELAVIPEFAPASPSAPALPDLPVASILPPVAPLLQTPDGSTPLEARIERLESELAQLRTAQSPDSRALSLHPAAVVVHHPGRFWTDVGKRLVAPSAPSASPPPRTVGLSPMVPPGARRTWMLLDALTELRAMYWMFFDPRYRLSWTARLAPLVVLALILTSGFWMATTGLPFVGFVIDKIVDLMLAYILFKLLSYEARRYRETAPDLPPSLRR